jgi:CHAD domain-containing protein
MLKQNFIIKCWQSELTFLRQSLSVYDGIDPESVHKIRVSIKKLRAYLKVYLLLCKDKGAKDLFQETEALFSLMGKHRNMEISKQKATEVIDVNGPLGSAYLAWLQLLQDDLPSVHDAVSNFNDAELDQLTIEIKKKLGHLDSDKLRKETSNINYHLLKKVKANLRRFTRNFHQVRKDLKNIYYLIRISFPRTDFSKKKTVMLDKILELLGNIQDEEVSLEFLRRYQKTIFIKQHIKMLKNARKRIKVRKSEALKIADRKIGKFLRAI